MTYIERLRMIYQTSPMKVRYLPSRLGRAALRKIADCGGVVEQGQIPFGTQLMSSLFENGLLYRSWERDSDLYYWKLSPHGLFIAENIT